MAYSPSSQEDEPESVSSVSSSQIVIRRDVFDDFKYDSIWDYLISDRCVSNTRNLYNAWALNYDEDMALRSYSAPKLMLNFLEKLDVPKCSNILDVGCGTGLLGVTLGGAGYINIDGIDLSEEMLNICKQPERSCFYNNFDLQNINGQNPVETRDDQKYDVICLCSSFQVGHVQPEAIEQLDKVLNSDGLIIWLSQKMPSERLQATNFEKKTFAKFLENFERRLNLKCITLKIVPDYMKNVKGILGCLKKSELERADIN